MRVYLAVGHGTTPTGAHDPGAVGPAAQEYDQAFAVTAAAHLGLARSGVDHFTETAGGPGHDPDYRGSAAAVNAGGYGLAVEIHFDWLGTDSAPTPSGGFGLYVSDDGSRLCDMVGARWSAAGMPRRPTTRRSDLYFLNATTPPAVIWECDRVDPHSAADLAAMGEAIAAGICDFLGVAYAASGPPAPLPPVDPPVAITGAVGVASAGVGSWTATADGGVFARGGAPFFGSMGGHPLAAPVVAIVGHGPGGYWLIGADGGIFAFGDAPVIAPTPVFPPEYRAGAHHMVGAARVGERLLQVANDGDLYAP